MTLNDILKDAVSCLAIDIILGGGEPPRYRIGTQLVSRGSVPIDGEPLARMLYEVLLPWQIERLESERQVDVSLDGHEGHRFRINVFNRRGGLAAVIRPIPLKVQTPQELGIPVSVMQMLERASGLIMVTGRVGTGKSTICSSFIEHLNSTKPVHVVTLEDPIEYVFTPKLATISQREIPAHVPSFAAALKSVLRQSPDVIYVGELRDMETIESTLSVAETGHLVLANLHTANATQTIHRIVDVFPPAQRNLVNVQLANSLTAVICQNLLPRVDGKGLVAAREIMVNTTAIANLIRKNEVHKLHSMMEGGGASDMKTMERSLAELCHAGIISLDVAKANAIETEDLDRHIDNLREEAKAVRR